MWCHMQPQLRYLPLGGLRRATAVRQSGAVCIQLHLLPDTLTSRCEWCMHETGVLSRSVPHITCVCRQVIKRARQIHTFVIECHFPIHSVFISRSHITPTLWFHPHTRLRKSRGAAGSAVR